MQSPAPLSSPPPTPPPPPYRHPVVTEVKPDREGRKSRIFSADLLCIVTANQLWELGATARENTLRPVLVAYTATEQAARAFTANLRTGRPAVTDADADRSSSSRLRFELPRSAGFQFDTWSRDGATLTLAYLRSVFALHPSVFEQQRIEFLYMPPTWWVEREAAALTALGALGKDARDAARAAYFVAYLDARSPLPIANDHRFHLELFRAALASGWCYQPDSSSRRNHELYARGCEALGFESPVVVSTTHAEFSAFLAEQTANHLPRVRQEAAGHGKTRIGSARRLLPHPAGPARELGLPG